ARGGGALARCLRHGAGQVLVGAYLHMPLLAEGRELLTALLDRLEPHALAGVEVLVAATRWRTVDVSVSHLASKLVDLTDAKALVALVEMDGRVFAVARSRIPEVDASARAGALGGGGHAQAAPA